MAHSLILLHSDHRAGKPVQETKTSTSAFKIILYFMVSTVCCTHIKLSFKSVYSFFYLDVTKLLLQSKKMDPVLLSRCCFHLFLYTTFDKIVAVFSYFCSKTVIILVCFPTKHNSMDSDIVMQNLICISF